MRRAGFAIVAVGAAAACAGPGTHEPADGLDVPSRVEVRTGDPFELAPGEVASLPGADLTIRFMEVVEDSRCPTDVTCVWEGDAAVAVETVQGGIERAWLLHAPGERVGPRGVDLDGVRLELVGLAPEPLTGEVIAPEEYRATFVVQ